MEGRREPSADAPAPKSSTSSQQAAARELILSNPNPTPPSVTPNDGIARTTISHFSNKYVQSTMITQTISPQPVTLLLDCPACGSRRSRPLTTMIM